MDNFEDIYNKVIEICKDYEHQNKPVIISNKEENFYSDLGLDSLAVVEIAMLCENEFNIMINDDDISKMRTVKDLVKIILDFKND